jgi:hypothetical protein
LLGLSRPTTTIRTIKISRRNQASSKKNLPKVPKKVHHPSQLLLLSLSSKTSPMIKRKLNLRPRSRLKNNNLSLKVNNHNIKKLSLSSLPPKPNRNNNRSHKRKSPFSSNNTQNLKDYRGSSRQRVLSWQKVSTSKRISRCT